MSSFWWTSAEQGPSQATKKNGQHMKEHLCWDIKGRAVPRPQERKAKRTAARWLLPPRAPPTLTGRSMGAEPTLSREGAVGTKLQVRTHQRGGALVKVPHQEGQTGNTPDRTNLSAAPPAWFLTDSEVCPTKTWPEDSKDSDSSLTLASQLFQNNDWPFKRYQQTKTD